MRDGETEQLMRAYERATGDYYTAKKEGHDADATRFMRNRHALEVELADRLNAHA